MSAAMLGLILAAWPLKAVACWIGHLVARQLLLDTLTRLCPFSCLTHVRLCAASTLIAATGGGTVGTGTSFVVFTEAQKAYASKFELASTFEKL